MDFGQGMEHQDDKTNLGESVSIIETIQGYHGVKVERAQDSVVALVNADDIKPFITFLRDTCEFQTLMDITAVDYPEREPRFDVVYHLLSVTHNERIRVKAAVEDGGSIASITELYDSADWLERETYDMFGIPFDGHPNLERILTDYTFEGYPLRKDYPLGGTQEVEYDATEGKVVYRPTTKN